jgi:hypothetical protein
MSEDPSPQDALIWNIYKYINTLHCITLLHIYIVYTCIHNIHYITCLHIIIYNIHVWYVCGVSVSVWNCWSELNEAQLKGPKSWQVQLELPGSCVENWWVWQPLRFETAARPAGQMCVQRSWRTEKKNLEHRFRDFQGCPRFHMPQMWVSSSRTCYRFPHRCWYQPFVHSLMLCWRWIKSSALSRFFCGTNVSRRIQLCQLRKATVLLHEFQGWPHLCQLPGVQDTDTVATHDGGDPMRDA